MVERAIVESPGRAAMRIGRASSGTRFLVSRKMGQATWATALLLALVTTPALAQATLTPAAPPTTAAVSPSKPPPEPGSRFVLDQIAGCVDSGTLNLEIDLRAGRVPVADAWKVGVVGTATAALVATAAGGHVSRLDVAVNGGTLLLEGNHVRPKILIESLRFEEWGGPGVGAVCILRGAGPPTWTPPEPFMVNIGGHPFPVLWSIIGAALFVAIMHLFSRRRW